MKKYCVIGDPISHSSSPIIYNFLFEHYKIDAQYSKIKVAQNELKTFVNINELDGFNVTIPHKQKIMPYLDILDDSALLYNSVNTVLKKDDKLIGYSTDALGFKLSLDEYNLSLREKTVFLFGSGGAASALALLCAQEKAKELTLCSRNEHAKQEIYNLISKYNLKINLCDAKRINNSVENSNIFINCTPLGMESFKSDFTDFSFLDNLKANATICDIVYKPLRTNLLQESQKRNLKTIEGISMLIYQAFAAFEIFTGIQPPFELKQDIIKLLGL